MTIIEEVDKFMSSSANNAWISDKFIRIYVRKGRHYFEGATHNTIDVANIVHEPEYRGKGYFKNFMIKVESLGFPVFVECIHNPNLVTMLEKHGYIIFSQYHDTHAIKFQQ